MDDPQLQERLELFTPEYQALVVGPVPHLAAQTFGSALELDQREQNVIENGFRLHLMALLNEEEWVAFVAEYTSLDTAASQMLVQEIRSHIAEDIRAQLKEDSPKKTASAGSTKESNATPAQDPAPQQDTPERTEEIPAVRTMQGDYKQHRSNDQGKAPAPTPASTTSNDEPVHTSSQSDALAGRTEETSKPTAAPANPVNSSEKPPVDKPAPNEPAPTKQPSNAASPRWETERDDA